MRNFVSLLILAPCLLSAQGRGAAPAATPAATATVGRDFVREQYSKFEYRVPMRDGVKLFTSVYVPKDVFTDNRTYPILMQRTGYNVAHGDAVLELGVLLAHEIAPHGRCGRGCGGGSGAAPLGTQQARGKNEQADEITHGGWMGS